MTPLKAHERLGLNLIIALFCVAGLIGWPIIVLTYMPLAK